MRAQVYLYTFNNCGAICIVITIIEYEKGMLVYELSDDISHIKMH